MSSMKEKDVILRIALSFAKRLHNANMRELRIKTIEDSNKARMMKS